MVLLGELFQLLILALSQICSLFVPHIRVEIKDFKQECCSGAQSVYFAKKNHRIQLLAFVTKYFSTLKFTSAFQIYTNTSFVQLLHALYIFFVRAHN